MNNAIRSVYRGWIFSRINAIGGGYDKLLDAMLSKPFYCTLIEDSNRYADGMDMRYHFACELDIPPSLVETAFYGQECSILEVLVALAHRCETDTMSDFRYGDRTFVWFWDMIRTMGLSSYSDTNFDADRVNDILTRFVNRTYSSNGSGGIVYAEDATDMRCVSLWEQMQMYMNRICRETGMIYF